MSIGPLQTCVGSPRRSRRIKRKVLNNGMRIGRSGQSRPTSAQSRVVRVERRSTVMRGIRFLFSTPGAPR